MHLNTALRCLTTVDTPMKCLISDNHNVSRLFLSKLISPYANCDIAVDGREAIERFISSFNSGDPYSLVCIDIMMPYYDGHEVVREIRNFERERGIDKSLSSKVIMTSALEDDQNVLNAFSKGCDSYVVKPIEKDEFLAELRRLNVIG